MTMGYKYFVKIHVKSVCASANFSWKSMNLSKWLLISDGATGRNSGNAVASENKTNITSIAVIKNAINSSGVMFCRENSSECWSKNLEAAGWQSRLQYIWCETTFLLLFLRREITALFFRNFLGVGIGIGFAIIFIFYFVWMAMTNFNDKPQACVRIFCYWLHGNKGEILALWERLTSEMSSETRLNPAKFFTQISRLNETTV